MVSKDSRKNNDGFNSDSESAQTDKLIKDTPKSLRGAATGKSGKLGSNLHSINIIRSTSMIDLQPLGSQTSGPTFVSTDKPAVYALARSALQLESGTVHASREEIIGKFRRLLAIMGIIVFLVLFSTTIMFSVRYMETSHLLSVLKVIYGDSEKVALAGRVISSMDRSIKPCEDFYGYACNQFIELNFVPPPLSGENGVFKQLDTARISYLTRLLQGEYSSQLETTIFQSDPDLRQVHDLLVKYYGVCRRSTPFGITLLDAEDDKITNFTINQFLESSLNSTIHIDRYIRGKIANISPDDPEFPAKVNSEMFILNPMTLAQYREIDPMAKGDVFGSWLIDFIIYTEYAPNLRPQVGLLTPFPVGDALMLNGLDKKLYRNLVSFVLNDYVYPDSNKADIDAKVLDILALESRLREITPSERQTQMDKNWPRLSLEQLQRNYPNIAGKLGWTRLLESVGLPREVLNAPNFAVCDPSPATFQQLDRLYAETSTVILRDYALFIAWVHLSGVAQLHGFLVPGLMREDLEIGWPLFAETPQLRKNLNHRSLLQRYKHKGFMEMNFAASAKAKTTKKKHNDVLKVVMRQADAKISALKTFHKVTDLESLLKIVRKELEQDGKLKNHRSKKQGLIDGMCLADSLEKFPLAIGRFYEHLVLGRDKSTKIAKIFEDIRGTYRARMADPISEPWLDQISRAAALEKLDFMQSIVSLPDIARTPRFIHNFYSDVNVSAFSTDSHMPAVLQSMRFINLCSFRNVQLDLATLLLASIQDWTEVNAFYVDELNLMVIPMGLWNSHITVPSAVSAFDYGIIGAAVGHEITHGFDTNGIQFDKYGNDKPIMNDATTRIFLKNSRCFASYFSEFDYRGIKTLGNSTLGENIADNGGLKVAYHAFLKQQSSSHTAADKLPGLDLSPNQLFWLGNAQFWCASLSDAEAQERQNDEHAMAEVRVNAGYSLIEEFATDWQCAKGSRMAPSISCKLWRRN